MNLRTIIIAAAAVVLAHAAEPICQPAQIAGVEAYAVAIANVEGWKGKASNLVHRLHNPGALVFIGQPSAVRHPSGYAVFPDDVTGWNALRADLRAKVCRGWSIERIAATWSAVPSPWLAAVRQEIRAGKPKY